VKKLTKKQKQDWDKWIFKLPENVKKVAEKIVPWKEYKDKRIHDDVGNRYIPYSYGENKDGTVILVCKKINREVPLLGGYDVFGMSPDDLEEVE